MRFGRRQRRLAMVAAIVAVAVWALVWLFVAPRDASRTGARPAAEATRSQRAAPPVASVAVVPSPASAISVPEPAHGPDEVQVCGGAWVRVEPDGSFDEAEFKRATQLPKASAAILARLNAEPGEMARLAALLLAAIDRDDLHRRALFGTPAACEGAECAATQAAEAEVAEAREAIARKALASSDPKVYALALNVCNGRREGACQLLSARQLARLDPGNASPWLQILAEATARKDAAAQDEALHRIARAERNEFGAFSLAGAVLKATPIDDSAMLASFSMAVTAMGVEAAWTMHGYQGVSQLCGVDALRDANRAQVCADVASMLAERSDTMIGRNMGAAIGQRIGWPAERADRMRGEYNAFAASLAPAEVEKREEFSCARIRRELDRMRSLAALGEVGAMREWVRQSGKGPEAFIREEQERQQRYEVAKQAAAASAAAASAAR